MQGSVERGVECQVEQNYETGEVAVTRLDMDVVVERRQMTERERELLSEKDEDETPRSTVQ